MQGHQHWSVRGVLWLWLLNDERWGCVQGYAPINKLWTMNPVRSCALWFTNKIALAMMSEQLAEGENEVQLASIWGQNELLEGLWRCLWDQEARLIWPKGSQGRFSQFRPSILGSFLVSFWKTWETKTASIDEVCVRCTFGIEFWSKNNRFWYQIRTEGRSYFSISSEMRKVDFWTTVHVCWRFLFFSTTLGSRELEAKISFKTQLERDINLALILSWFWSQNSSEIGSKID